ncbi:MAG: chlorophyll synthesis pathway protein BchC [Gemmatimonadota bacterium]
MDTLAVVFDRPESLSVKKLSLIAASDSDVVVDVEWSGISTGTEKLLWTGRMPDFPGMGYPLVPGYETVGRVTEAGASSGRVAGERVFVAGSRCFEHARGLFGGAASRLIVPGARAVPVRAELEERAILLSLAATAYHAIRGGFGSKPDLVIGHGVLGRLLARLAVGLGGGKPVTVWETNPARRSGAHGYTVCDPADDPRKDYRAIYDVSGDSMLLDALIGRIARGGEIVLAGFYSQPLSFNFAPAFQREARLRVAAEFEPSDLQAVALLAGVQSHLLDDLISHRSDATDAAAAYETAFTDSSCVKMVLDWRACA